MKKRILVVFCTFMFLFCMSMILIGDISGRERLYYAASGQRSYKLKVTDVRGTIYDCNKVPLVNRSRKLIAAITPGTQISSEIVEAVPNFKVDELWKKLSLRQPFTIEVNKNLKFSGIKVFNVPVRYDGIISAAHIIGYVSGDGKGVSGIEKAYNEYLENEGEDVCVRYMVDASNRLLSGGKGIVDDKSYLINKGVMLNIDCKMQVIAEQIANKYISKGAVIITEVPGCEIRALASLPTFTAQNIPQYLNDKNSPLVNRAFAPYSFGSIFKLITASAALESGINPDFQYDCRGVNEVNGTKFKCFDSKPHGVQNMSDAIANSCNGYFIEIAKKIGPDLLLDTAKKFHLGSSIELAPGMFCSRGILPKRESLDLPGTLANFSFGQGKLTAVPIQVSGIINAIASGGVYTTPKLVYGLVGEDMKVTSSERKGESNRVISNMTAKKLTDYMTEAVEHGTAYRGKPETVSAAAKTSTAQTGIILEDGQEIIQSWYAGFFPKDEPKYSVVILCEGETSGGSESCGAVFKEIADTIYSDLQKISQDTTQN